MKTIAVIAECNPLHRGHAYFFHEAKQRAGADCLLVLLSGDYVQRGEPALFNKYQRAEMALQTGADLVFELPVVFATGSARRFAEGAIRLLDDLQIVDELWFGSETGVQTPFTELTQFLLEEPAPFSKKLQESLAQGNSYPLARQNALSTETGLSEEARKLPATPNNTLGLAYCMALARCGSKIKPQTLIRKDVAHDDSTLHPDRFSSATAIRQAILEKKPFSSFSQALPEIIREQVSRLLEQSRFLASDDFSDMLLYALYRETEESLISYLDVDETLANRILHHRDSFRDFSSFAFHLKTKGRTLTHIQRALLHILLQIREEDFVSCMQQPALRLLGHYQADQVISAIKKQGRMSVISNTSALVADSYQKDLFASHLYEAVSAKKSGIPMQSEFHHPMLTITRP